MTVASLWKALDRAGCGRTVGIEELLDHHGARSKINPWNHREMHKLSKEHQPVLAVDLSIWICEALASSAMKHHHVADPALQLVYSRVLKLLNLGIKLVVVVEGKRRSRTRPGKDDEGNTKPMKEKFRKRRSGAPFWTACERCEAMLKWMGVIVVRATAEGEALCALLNQRGIVDGVISNDGDCLLFGAKVLYTKFSVENLEKSSIIRYDANDIRVVLDDDDADKFDQTGKKKDGRDVVELSRKDLIAFAILTGSDLAGEGLSKVGCRKAIRFIRKCQIDNPLKVQADKNSSQALEQLLSWEQTAARCSECDIEEEQNGPRCSCCGHFGTKREHKKFGCKGCGTEPGESCFPLSPGGRFRKMLRAKALSMQSAFDPSSTLQAYYEPNDNQIPLCLMGKSARTLQMNRPQTEKILEFPFIIRGKSFQESRQFVQKSLSTYLARKELHDLLSKPQAEGEKPTKLHRNTNRPTPVCVSKLMVRNGKPSCQVQWKIKATTSDAEGNPLDEFEFSTIEDESIVKKCYPILLQDFHQEQKKIQQQGSTEQEKRRNFLLSMEQPKDAMEEAEVQLNGTKKNRARKDYFDQNDRIPKAYAKRRGVSDDVAAIKGAAMAMNDGRRQDKAKTTDAHIGRLVSTEIDGFRETRRQKRVVRPLNDDVKGLVSEAMMDDTSTIHTSTLLEHDKAKKPREDYFRHALTSGPEHYLGIESAFQFRCMAGDGCHPKLDLVEPNSWKDKPLVPMELNHANLEKEFQIDEKAPTGKPGVDSICRELFPRLRIKDEKPYRCESEKAQEFPQRRDVRFSSVNKEYFSPQTEDLCHSTEMKEIGHVRKRRKSDRVEEKKYDKDNLFYEERGVSRKECPRENLSTPHCESTEYIHCESEYGIHVDKENRRHLMEPSELPKKDFPEFSLLDFLPLEHKQVNTGMEFEIYDSRNNREKKQSKQDPLESDLSDEKGRQGERRTSIHKERDDLNQTKTYRSKILQDVCQNAQHKRDTKGRKKKHRHKCEKKSKLSKSHRSHSSKRDEHHRHRHKHNPSNEKKKLEDRNECENFFSYYNKRNERHREQSSTEDAMEIEKHMEAKMESLTRRAEANRLYMKYIEDQI